MIPLRALLVLPALLLLISIASARSPPEPPPPPPFELRIGDDFAAAEAAGILTANAASPGSLAVSLRAYADATLTIDSYAILEAREPALLAVAVDAEGNLAQADVEVWNESGTLASITPGTSAQLAASEGDLFHVRVRLTPDGGTSGSLHVNVTGTLPSTGTV